MGLSLPPSVLVIGIGNEFRGDDGVGVFISRQIADGADVQVLEQSGEGAALMEAWREAVSVILLDAVQTGSAPGTVHRLDAHAQEIPAQFFHYSTHAFSVAEAVELARALGQLPPRLVIFGIEGASFETGVPLSPAVLKAAQEVVAQVREEIQRLTNEQPCTSSP